MSRSLSEHHRNRKLHFQTTKLSTEKRLLLHLVKYSNYEEEWEVPIDISQEGISNKLKILQNNVSRALTSLKEEHLVFERLSYIKKGKRRRKTYFLTGNGRVLVKNFEKELLNEMISIKTKDNDVIEKKVSKLIDFVENEYSKKIDIQEIIEYIIKNGVLDIRDLIKEEEKKDENVKTSNIINYTEKAPKLYHFYGREKELKEIKICIESKEYGIIVIQGIAGIGKTTLALKIIEEYKNSKNLFWYRFHDWDSIKNISTNLSEFLVKQGKKKLSNYIKKKTHEINEIGNIIENDLNNCILFFDDFQRAENEILNLFSIFLEIVERNKDIKIIILTRESRAFYDIRDVEIKKIIKEIKLEPFNKQTSRMLLKEGINSESFENIYNLTKGVPLFLELIGSESEINVNDINTFIDQEIFSKLSTNERNLLNIISVFRLPVPSSVLLTEEGIIYEDITSLVNRLIISLLPLNKFEVHDIIRDLLYSRLSVEQKKKYHRIAADYYLKCSQTDINLNEAIEALFHLQKSEEWDDASDFAKTVVPYLISEGNLEVKEILKNFLEHNISQAKWSDILVLKGDFACFQENWYEASKNYKNALQIKQKLKSDNYKLAEIHGKLGNAQMNINQWEETIHSHEKALNIYKEMGKKKGVATKNIDLGLVLKNRKEFKKAIVCYNKSLEIFESLKDKRGQATVYNNLGLLFQAKHKYEEAKKYFEISKKLSANEKDFFGKAITLFNIAEMDFGRRRYDSAVNNFIESAEAFKKAKKVKNEITCTIKIGDVYFQKRNYKDALNYYLISLKKLEKIGKEKLKIFSKKLINIENDEFIILWNKIANTYEENNELENALEYQNKILKIMEKENNRVELARKYLELGIIYENLKDYKNGILNMEKSLILLEEIKEIKGIIALNLNLGRIYKKNGNQGKAKLFYEKALNNAKKVKDKQGIQNAYEALEKLHSIVNNNEE